MLYPEYNLIGYKSKLESPTLIGVVNEVITPEQPCEFYKSVYRFSRDISNLPSLANVPNTTAAYADYLIFDFDSHSDLSLAYSDCLDIHICLEKLNVKSQMWASGGKGYHLYVPTSQFGFEPTSDAEVLKRMAQAIAGEKPTFDDKVYNKTRIFREPYSFNIKGVNFKMPVDKDDTGLIENNLPVNPDMVKLYQACLVKVNRVVQDNVKENANTLFVKVHEGSRNEAVYTLTRKLARRGLGEVDALFIVKAWNKQLPKPLPEYEVVKTVQSAYTKGMNEFVDENTYANHIYEIDRAINECSTTFLQQGQGAFLTGYEFMDKLSMGFYPGEVIGIVARSSNFKTAFLENLLQRGSLTSQRPVLFFSQEMPNSTLTLRRIQKSYGLTKKEAVEWVKTKQDRTKLIEDWKYVKTCYLSNLGIEEMLGLVDYYSETYGPLAAIGIDYLGLCKGTNNNREKTARMATDLKTKLARAAKAPVFILTQAKQTYEGEKGSIELDRACIKDSDTVIDSLDYAFGLWKKWGQVDNVRDFLIFGKSLKDRGMDLEAWGTDPYFYLKLDKPFMDVKDLVYVENPPPFDRIDKQHKEEM